MPMTQYKYMTLPIYIIQRETINEYQITNEVKMTPSCLKSESEFTDFHRQEWFQTKYSQREFQRTHTAPVS